MSENVNRADQEKTCALPPSERPMPVSGTENGNSGTFPGADVTVALASSNAQVSGVGRFGDYLLLEEIARGGMGVVYRARQESLNRTVALKMILTGRLASEDDVRRFRSEAEAAANLDHSGIVPIYEIGQHEGQHYFSMKLIEGESLSRAIPKFANDHPAAVELVAALAEAVHHAHQRGILHRDLKPANVLLDEAGRPHITDFGLARQVEGESGVTRTGDIVGTPSYMPPEQARGEKILTTAADVYSLGAILYELLSGNAPFRGANVLDTVLQVINEVPKSLRGYNSKIDRDLELICLKCLQKNPSERYSSAAELESDLRHWLAGEPLSIRAPAIASLMRLWLRQNFGAAGWTVIVGVVFGLLSGGLFWMASWQTNVASLADVYDHLPNVGRPWLMYFDWAPSELQGIILSGIAIFSFSYVGLFTAALVRPKNRHADLAAGVVTGAVAGFATFLVFWGPFGLLSRFNDDDIKLLERAAFWYSEDVMSSWTYTYPDLKNIPKEKRAEILSRKVQADQLVSARTGLWLGLLVGMALALSVSIGEMAFAGPLLRRLTWYQAIIPYSEVAFAVTVLCFVAGIYLLLPIIGSVGVHDAWKISFLILMIALAIWAAFRPWHWLPRILIQVIWVWLFIDFLFHGIDRSMQLGRHRAEIAKLEQQIRVDPENVNYQYNLVNWHGSLGWFWAADEKWQKAADSFEEAIRQAKSLRSKPLSEGGHLSNEKRLAGFLPVLVNCYDQLGRQAESDRLLREAAADWSKLSLAHPDAPHHKQLLADTQAILARRAANVGNAAPAREQYEEALKIRAKLVADFPNRQDLRSQLAASHHGYGTALRTIGDPSAAVQHYEKALLIRSELVNEQPEGENYKSELADTLNSLAWVLATSSDDKLRDGKRALELAVQANELTYYGNANYLDTLAGAYAECGDFDSAVKWSIEAVERANAVGNVNWQKQFARALATYKAKKPMRELPAEAER